MKSPHCWSLLTVVAVLSLVCSGAEAQEEAKEYKNGVVVCVSAPATDVGLRILKEGGNAVDAAVATAFALAVTHPGAGNIGGGGFMMIHLPGGKTTCIEYRETAPAAAHAKMYKKDESIYTHRAVGVPGTVRGMALAHKRYGKLPWKTLVQPAVLLAREGFVLDEHHADSLNRYLHLASDAAEFQRVFAKKEGTDWSAGDRLLQPDLAKTMQLIAEQGPDAFYSGLIADLLVAEMKQGGGLITKEDLAKYQAKERTPIHGTYRGHDVYGPPPPSSGGICLVQMLNMLETFDLKKQDRFSPRTTHLMIEAMRRSFLDRARHLGDADFVKIPAFFTSKEYARELAKGISEDRATKSEDLAKDIPLTEEGDSTTHFSIIDKEGMAVANTYTLERTYGSRIVVRGAGFLLNNEMMDFNWRPGITNRAGLIGTAPNLIAPGKRMLSSMTPTIVSKGGKVVLVTGSPGGRTIINTVLGMVLSVVEYEMPLPAAVDAPRLHHQWLPDEVRMEPRDEQRELVKGLEALGHRVFSSRQGDAHSIWVNHKSGGYVGAADKRLSGKAAGY